MSEIGEILESAIRDGLLSERDGVVYRHYDGDLADPQPADPVPFHRDVRVAYDGEVYGTTIPRVVYAIRSGEWPYGLFVRAREDGEVVATISPNSWITEADLEAMLADYTRGVPMDDICRRFDLRPRAIRDIAARWMTQAQREQAERTRTRRHDSEYGVCPCGNRTLSGRSKCWRCTARNPRRTCACGRQMNGEEMCGVCRKQQRPRKLHPCRCGRRSTAGEMCYLCRRDDARPLPERPPMCQCGHRRTKQEMCYQCKKNARGSWSFRECARCGGLAKHEICGKCRAGK